MDTALTRSISVACRPAADIIIIIMRMRLCVLCAAPVTHTHSCLHVAAQIKSCRQNLVSFSCRFPMIRPWRFGHLSFGSCFSMVALSQRIFASSAIYPTVRVNTEIYCSLFDSRLCLTWMAESIVIRVDFLSLIFFSYCWVLYTYKVDTNGRLCLFGETNMFCGEKYGGRAS